MRLPGKRICLAGFDKVRGKLYIFKFVGPKNDSYAAICRRLGVSPIMTYKNRTRGFGMLEKYLSSQRAHLADGLIPHAIRKGAILDIGCGPYPYFLTHTEFNIKVGIDQESHLASMDLDGIKVQQWDIGKNDTLPFPDESFDAVTMLAVIEHLEGSRLISILNEIHRIMKPGGCLIITSPSFWTAPILFVLSRISVISKLEIDDHKHTYSLSELSFIIGKSVFSASPRFMGHFECGMNMWLKVIKAEAH
jgi:SAM-dependent methyltransferase